MGILQLCDETAPAGMAPETSVAEAINTMIAHRVGAVVVVDADNVVAGIFSERDVMTKVALSGRDPATIHVAEVMTTPVFLATKDTTPGQALAVMVNTHVRHLPVVNNHGKLIGTLSIRHLLQARVDELTRELDALEKGQGNSAP